MITALDPSIRVPGPRVLLLRRDRLESLLEDKGLVLVWIGYGRKDLLGGSSPSDWQGELVLSGVWTLTGNGPIGDLTAEFRGPTVGN